MRLSDCPKLSAAQLQDRQHDFYRCYDCGWLFTRDHERATFARLSADENAEFWMCRCLSAKYRVSRPRALEWLRPSVLAYAWKVVLARKLAPWLEQRLPGALKYVEKLVI